MIAPVELIGSSIREFFSSLLHPDAIFNLAIGFFVLALIVSRDRRAMRKRHEVMRLIDEVTGALRSLREENKELRRLLQEATSSQKAAECKESKS